MYLIKVYTPLNMLLSKAIIVLFVITLKLGADNHSHHFLTYPVNVPIIFWILVLLSQFVACYHSFNTVLISF